LKGNGKQQKVLYFKVVLVGRVAERHGKPYRIIAIPGALSLYNFAEVIVGSFDFEFDHPFGFYENLENWRQSREGYELFQDIGEESQFKGVRKTAAEKVFTRIKDVMVFIFDYGDEWMFTVELIRQERYPMIVERSGQPPPQYGMEYTPDGGE